MLRTRPTDSQRSELLSLGRTDLPAVARGRLERGPLSDPGWPPPAIAEHGGRHPHTVRAALSGFAARGTAAFHPDAPGPDPGPARRAKVTGGRAERLGRDHGGTRRQRASALGPEVGPGHRQARRYLARLKAGDRRTAQAAARGREPRAVARAGRVPASLGGTSRPAGRDGSPGAGAGSPRPGRPGARGACRASGSGCGASTRRGGGSAPWPPTGRPPGPSAPSRSSGRAPATTC